MASEMKLGIATKARNLRAGIDKLKSDGENNACKLKCELKSDIENNAVKLKLNIENCADKLKYELKADMKKIKQSHC